MPQPTLPVDAYLQISRNEDIVSPRFLLQGGQKVPWALGRGTSSQRVMGSEPAEGPGPLLLPWRVGKGSGKVMDPGGSQDYSEGFRESVAYLGNCSGTSLWFGLVPIKSEQTALQTLEKESSRNPIFIR